MDENTDDKLKWADVEDDGVVQEPHFEHIHHEDTDATIAKNGQTTQIVRQVETDYTIVNEGESVHHERKKTVHERLSGEAKIRYNDQKQKKHSVQSDRSDASEDYVSRSALGRVDGDSWRKPDNNDPNTPDGSYTQRNYKSRYDRDTGTPNQTYQTRDRCHTDGRSESHYDTRNSRRETDGYNTDKYNSDWKQGVKPSRGLDKHSSAQNKHIEGSYKNNRNGNQHNKNHGGRDHEHQNNRPNSSRKTHDTWGHQSQHSRNKGHYDRQDRSPNRSRNFNNAREGKADIIASDSDRCNESGVNRKNGHQPNNNIQKYKDGHNDSLTTHSKKNRENRDQWRREDEVGSNKSHLIEAQASYRNQSKVIANHKARTASGDVKAGNIKVADLRFISKLDHGDTSGENLKDFGVQEAVYGIIQDKLQGLPMTPTAHDYADSLVLFRKLREAIMATKRLDPFVIKVYEHAATTALDAGDMSEYHVCVVNLTYTLYPGVMESSDVEQEVKKSLELQWINCFAELITYCGCYLGAVSEVLSITQQISSSYLGGDAIRTSLRAAQAVESSDYFQFFALLNNLTGRRRSVMLKSADIMRRKALAVFRKAYVVLDLKYVTEILRMPTIGACSDFLIQNSPTVAADIKDNTVNFRPKKS